MDGDDDRAMEEAKKVAEAKKLPMAQRVENKLWKIRAEAYDDMKATCEKIMSDDDPALTEYGKLLAKSLTDANAPALDKALDALLAWQAKCSVSQATSVSEKCCSTLFTKAMNGRPGIVVKASQVYLSFIELEQAETVLENIISKGLAHKVPKVVAASVDVLFQAVSAFGTKVVSPQTILKALPPLFESRDAKTREKVKATVVELSRWVGADTVKGVLFDKMREAMQGDVSKLIDQAPEGRPKPERIIRSEQLRLQAQEAAGDGQPMDEDVEEEEETVLDEFDLSAPAEVLGELQKDWWAALQEKKWVTRKGALTKLKDLASRPRLAAGDYGDVLRELKKIITKDSNVQCIAEAANCLGALARGLRQDFSGPAKSFCPVLLEKLKEKNPVVGRAVPEALASLHKHCFRLQDVVDDAVAALGHANPKVRQQTLEWLKTCAASESKDTLKQVQSQLTPGTAKLTDDSLPAIREAALAVLLEFCLKAPGVTAIEKITSKLADNRRKKLEEMIQSSKQSTRAPAPTPPAAPAAAPTAPKPGPSKPSAPKKAPVRSPSPASNGGGSEPMAIDSEPPSAPVKKGPPPLSSRQPAKAAAIKQVKLAGPPPGEDDAALASGNMNKETCIEQMTVLFGGEVMTELQDTVWKKRLEALDTIIQAAKEIDVVANAKLLVNGMANVPGWGEKNFQVMSRQFELIRFAAERGEASFGKSEAFVAIKGLYEKMGDIKLKTPAADALSMICEAVGPQFVFDQMHCKAASHKNPKVLAETLNWMSKAVQEFGLGVMNTKNLINWIQVDVASTNPAVRNAAVALAGCLHSFVGPALGEMLQSGVKPAQMTTIQQAFDKNPQLTDFAPVRTPRTGKKVSAGGKEKSKKGSSPAAAFDPDELLPRADISSQITSSVIGKLTDSNWKNRKSGLEEVEGILSGAGNRIQPTTGELIPTLKGITKDSNRNLAATGIKLMGKIATAMGKAIERQGRPVLAPALLCISDTKTLVRAAVIEMLGAWTSAAGVASVMPEVASTAAGPKCSADGKTDLVNWFMNLVNGGQDVQDSLESATKLVAATCSDKISAVKEKGNSLMQLLVDKYGSEVGGAAQALDGPLKKAAMEAIQKAGGGVSTSAPAKAQQSKAGSGGSIPRPSTAPKRPNSSNGNRPAKIPAGRANGAAARAPKEDKMEVDEQPLLQFSEHKEARARKNRGKRAKYDGIPPDEADSLKAELDPLVAPALKSLLFATDFKKHCTAAEMLTKAVDELYNEAMSCLDLLLRWAVMRIVEGNTQCLVKTLEMLKTLLEAMTSRGDRLSEYEAIILLPVVVEKSGHNQDRIKKEHRDLMVLATKVMSPSKVFVFLADGLESKNNRTKVECAEEVGAIIDREGMKVGSGQKQVKAFPVIAAAVSSRDAAFRKACLATLEVVYDFEGEKVWKMLGRLTDQQRSLIEERLKVRSRQLIKKGLTPGFRNPNANIPADEPEVQVRKSPPPGAFGLAPSPGRSSPGSGIMPPSTNGYSLAASNEGRIPAFNNSRGIPRPGAYSPSPGSAMGSTPRTASPRTISPLPDPPEMGHANGNFGQRASDHQRSDADIEMVWTRAMVTMVSGPIGESIDALKVLCFELMEASKGKCSDSVLQLMTDSADELVKELVAKMELVFYEAAGQSVASQDPPSNRGCKYTLNTMMQAFGIAPMAQTVKKSTLKDTIACLLTLLLDERLPRIHEGAQLMKAMNVLVLQMLEVCNKNDLFGLLLELLRYQPPAIQKQPPGIQEKFSNLVIKCLIKMTKSMGNLLMSGQEANELDIKRLIWDLHMYFVALGVDEIRRRGEEEDKPLKMVKTILHEICRHKGTGVVKYVDNIPHDEEPLPIILAYIDLNLQTLHNTGIISGELPPAFSDNDHVISQYFGSIEAAQSPPLEPNPPSSPSRSLASTVSADGSSHDTMKAELAAIFKKIGDKSLSREGMEDLYRFQQEHPAVDVMPYLSNTSDAFQAYIERGLQRIHAKRRNASQRTPTSTPVSYSAASSVVEDTDDMEVDEVSEESPRCPTPTPTIPTPRSIPRPGGIPKPSTKPLEVVGDQVRSLRDFRAGNRFGRRD